VNSLEQQPDFIMFTGDLTHTTDDPALRRQRLSEFRDIVSGALHTRRARRVTRTWTGISSSRADARSRGYRATAARAAGPP
jgi:hypothetical protein